MFNAILNLTPKEQLLYITAVIMMDSVFSRSHRFSPGKFDKVFIVGEEQPTRHTEITTLNSELGLQFQHVTSMQRYFTIFTNQLL